MADDISPWHVVSHALHFHAYDIFCAYETFYAYGITMAIRYVPKEPPKPQPTPAEVNLKANLATRTGKPGRPPSGKVRLTLLVDPEVIERFKATGKGWQARMNAVLRANAP